MFTQENVFNHPTRYLPQTKTMGNVAYNIRLIPYNNWFHQKSSPI